MQRCVLAISAVAALATGSTVHAQLEPPPDPATLPPTYHLEVHGALVLPLARETMCPQGFACVLGAGFGAGAFVERRAADGLGLLVGYQVWLLDSASVYEVGAVHTLRIGLRWVIDVRSRVHPFLEVLGGALVLTDPAQAATGGGLLSVGGGAEIELTESVAITLALDVWGLAVGAFSTRDGARRAASFGVDVVSQIRVGATIVLGSGL